MKGVIDKINEEIIFIKKNNSINEFLLSNLAANNFDAKEFQ